MNVLLDQSSYVYQLYEDVTQIHALNLVIWRQYANSVDKFSFYSRLPCESLTSETC